jgi:FMN-dependent NADH-azoreductase
MLLGNFLPWMMIMDKVLFLNACVRPGSRTMELAATLLQKLDGLVEEVRLNEISMSALDLKGMEKRDQAAREKDFSDPVFAAARQFAAADVIVIAAPYWDLLFPAVLKLYLENVTVSGITFDYSSQGIPESLCKAKSLYYVTTAGGFIGQNDFGFSYVKALATNFFGISDVRCYTAEGLDIFGADADSIMNQAKASIIGDF